MSRSPHGLRRTTTDVKRAVEAALKHPKSDGMSDNQISKYIGCSQTWVSEIHRGMKETHLSANAKMANADAITKKTVTRNGTTYQQNTANIGKGKRDFP